MLGPRQEVALQQIVRGRRMDFHAREERVERSGDDLPRPERRCPNEHQLVGERPRAHATCQDVGSGHVWERALRTAVPHQQIALAIEGDGAIGRASGDDQRGPVHVGDPDRRRPGASGHRYGRERERRINVAVVLDEHGHAPKDAVRIGSGVEEPGDTGRLRETFEIAHRAGRLEERCAERFIRRLYDGETHRMVHACSGHVVGAIEGHGVAEDDAAAAKRGAERIVGGHGAALEAIRLGEHDVQRDDGRAEIAKIGHECSDHVPSPRPLPDRGETAFVHVDDDDPAADRTCRHPAHQPVIDVVLEAEQYRGTVERQHRDDEGGEQTAQQNQPAGT